MSRMRVAQQRPVLITGRSAHYNVTLKSRAIPSFQLMRFDAVSGDSQTDIKTQTALLRFVVDFWIRN